MKHAKYEILEDKTFYGSIPGFEGVWANEPILDACREELQDALKDWILFASLTTTDRCPEEIT